MANKSSLQAIGCLLLLLLSIAIHHIHAFSASAGSSSPSKSDASSQLLPLIEKLNLQPILGREPSHGATRPVPSLEWCEDHVASVRRASTESTATGGSPSKTSISKNISMPPNDENDTTIVLTSTPTTLGTFDKAAQVHVLRSIWPSDKCLSIVQAAEDYAQWSTGRHHLYPTTDVPVRDLPDATKTACLELAQEVLLPALARIFETPIDHLNFKDIFIAKYSSTGQLGLGAHTDGSAFSFNLLLSDCQDFEGGGTSFDDNIGRVAPSQGDVLMHRGSLRHQGNPITRGCRYILVGFVDSDPNYVLQTASATSTTSLSSRSVFGMVTIPTFPLGLVLEVDEGDADHSAVMVVSCDRHQGSAFAAGIRPGDCIRGVLLGKNDDDDDAENTFDDSDNHDFRLDAWDGKSFDHVMARLADLSSEEEPLRLVLERWKDEKS
jgi:hypothetical protein